MSGESNASCFGASVATGDLDGDDHPELIVADPPCRWMAVAPGRIAIYRGLATGYFSTTPVWTPIDWQNPPRGGIQMTVATGDVDGDGDADVLVRATGGAMVFTGITDVGVPLPAPAFRVPGTGTFGAAQLADFDGDGRSDLVSVRAGVATLWRSVAGPQPFVEARAFAGATGLVRVRDTNGDDRDDVVIVTATGAQLYRGCAIGAVGCTGGLRDAAVWSTVDRVVGTVPDQNHDGLDEVLLDNGGFGAAGRLRMHLGDPATGGFKATAIASTLGDPNYPAFGQTLVRLGDLDGDGRETEFLLGAAGRLYGFLPKPHDQQLSPRFAWPRANSIQAQLLSGAAVFTTGSLSPVSAGDLDGDGRAELVVGNSLEFDDTRPGRVYVFRGGKLHPLSALRPRPFLLGERTCGAIADPRPDLTVDRDALARSLYVERRAFAADSCEIAEACVSGPGVRKLLRFTTSIANLGGGPLVIPGPETAPQLYHFDACHGHDHLTDFAKYELMDHDGAVVAVGRKQGFFLVDIAPYCSTGHDAADYFPDQGISAGWSDVYVSSIPCQWLDVTGIPDGRYTLRVGVDTLNLVDQNDVLPDTARVRVRIHGDTVVVLD